MIDILNMLFAFNLSLLFIHEMDATAGKEWKMFKWLKHLSDEKGYAVFLALHIPLYTGILWLLLSEFFMLGYYIVDVFLIAHLILHICFRNHESNRLNGRFSKLLIGSTGVLAIFHLAGLLCIY